MESQSNHTIRKQARFIGGFMLIQMVMGIFLNFFFLAPILKFDPQGAGVNLINLLGISTIMAIALSGLNIIFGLLLPRWVTQKQYKNYSLLLIMAAIGVVLTSIEYAKLSEYVSYLKLFSQSANDITAPVYEMTRKLLATGRNELHFFSIMFSSFSLLLFYFMTYRSQLFPRPMAIFAIAAVLLQLIAVGHTLFEQAVMQWMQLPIALSQIVVPIYLLVFGFSNAQQQPAEALCAAQSN